MGSLHYRLRVRNAADSADDLVITSLPGDSVSGEVLAASDGFEYETLGALDAAWPETDTMGAASTWSIEETVVDEGLRSAELTIISGGGLWGSSYRTRTFTGLTPNTPVVVRMRCWENEESGGGAGLAVGLEVVGGTADSVPGSGPINDWVDLEAEGTTNGAGELTVRVGGFHSVGVFSYNRLIRFDDLNIYELGTVPTNPYIAEPPEGDGQTLNPITGEVQIGGFTVSVVDAVTATDTRVVTSKLADDDGRNALLSRRAYIEESEDVGANWTVLLAGWVNSLRMVSAIRFDFTIGESRRVEQTTKVFETLEDGFDRVSCIIGGPVIGGFGPYPDGGRPRFEVKSASGDEVTLRWLGGVIHEPMDETGGDIRRNVRRYLNGLADHYRGEREPGGAVLYPGLVCRLMEPTTGTGITSNPPTGLTEDTQDFTPLAFLSLGTDDSIRGLAFLSTEETIKIRWPASAGALPSVGTRYKLAVFPLDISERNPLHWRGHPVDLATELLTLRGESFNAASATAVKAELGPVELELRLTKPMTLAGALESLVYGPFGVGARTNESGEREFFTVRKDIPAPTGTLTNNDLVSDEGAAWSTEEGSAVNRVVLNTQSFSQLGSAFVDEDIGHTDDAIDFIAVGQVTHEAVPDESEVAVFGSQTITYDIPGRILGVDLIEFVALIGVELFDFQGRGAITYELSTRRGATDAMIGETIILDLAHLPTADPSQSPVSQRGTTPRLALLLRRTQTPSGPVLKLQDRGIAPDEQAAGDVEFTIAASVDDPRKVATVEITNPGAFTLGELIRVQMATGAGMPTSGVSVFLLDPASDAMEFNLPPVDAGAMVWARMRVERVGFAPGDWTAFESANLDDLDAPTSFAGTFTGTLIPLSWALGANAADIPLEILLRETGEPDYQTVAFLPAGTLSFPLTVPDPQVGYDIGVRHREAPPFNGMSPIATLAGQESGVETDTPDVPNEDDPPPAPIVPDATGGAGGGHLLVPFHSTESHGVVFRYPPAETAEMEAYGRRREDLSGYARCRVLVHVSHPLPPGATVSVQYVPATNTDPAEEDWLDIATLGGPFVSADGVTEIPAASAWLTLALEARQDVVLRPVVAGGDEATQFGTLKMFAEFMGTVLNDSDEPPPNPCQDSTLDFEGYEDQAAAEADGWTNVPDASAGGEMALDETGGVSGSKAIRMGIVPTEFNYTSNQKVTYQFTGLTVGTVYKFEGMLKISGSFDNDPRKGLFSVSVQFGSGALLNLHFPDANPFQDGNQFIGEFALCEFTNAGDPMITFPDGGGNIDLELRFSCLLAGATIPHSIWLDNIRVTEFDTGEVVLPCSSGPAPDPDAPGDPPTLPPSGARKVYLSGYLRSQWGDYPPFNGTVYTVPPGQLLATLTAARAAGIGVFLNVVSNQAKVGGVFSLSAALAQINGYAGLVAPEDWVDDWGDVLLEVRVMDEPESVVHWGTRVQWSVVDGVLAKRCQEIFGAIPLQVRGLATQLESSGYRPSYLNVMQMAWLARHGPVDQHMSTQRASAKRLGMAWGWGFNVLNGGSGSSGVHGESARFWRMSPTEITTVGQRFVADTESRSIVNWAGSSPPAAFLQEPAYVAAFQEIVDTLG